MRETESLDETVTDPPPDEVASDEQPSQSSPAPGDNVARYRIDRRIGRGGMGEVFAAHDPELDRVVALKMVLPSLVGRSPEARARFQREAQAMARLNHPNVVTVFDVVTAGDRVFVAMELVEGPTLDQWLAAEPRGWREVVRVMLEAGRGLEAVHHAGLLHRDFKPSNVILGDRVRVADFGLARRRGDPAENTAAGATILDVTVTETGAALGTRAYMAPEQRLGDPTEASDQYAFAVTLHEALYGVRPAEPLPPRRGVPRRFRAIVERATSFDRDARYPSMKELLAALIRARRGNARRWWIAAGAVAVVGASGLAWALGAAQPAADPCPAPEEATAAMWGPARRDAVRAQITATDPARGAARFAVADRTLRPFVDGWRAMHVDSCRATRVRGAQSDTMFDLREACLVRRAAELDASVAAVEKARDPVALDAAIAALVQLAPIAGCADTAALARDDDGPKDPGARAGIAALTTRIDAVEVDWRADRLVKLSDRARTLVADARALGHAATLTAALRALARVEMATGEGKAAVETLREMTQVAARAHRDRDEAFAWSALISEIGWDQAQPDDALLLMPAANAAVLRAGEPVELRVDLLYHRAMVLDGGPRIAEAVADLAKARELLEQAGANQPDSPLAHRLVDVLVETGNAQGIAGDQNASIASFLAALARQRALYGPDSTDEALAQHNLAETYRVAGRLDEARAAIDEAVRINTARGGKTLRVAGNLELIATIEGNRERWQDALDGYDRALAIYRDKLTPDDVQQGGALVGRAWALGNLDRHDAAREAYAAAIGLFQRADATSLNLPIAYFSRGEMLARWDHCDEALADFARSIDGFVAQQGPESKYLVNPLVGQGRCLVETGHAAAAIAPLERATKIEPEAEEVLYGVRSRVWLGRALVEARRDLPRGLALVRAARDELAAAAKTPTARAELRELDRWLAAPIARPAWRTMWA